MGKKKSVQRAIAKPAKRAAQRRAKSSSRTRKASGKKPQTKRSAKPIAPRTVSSGANLPNPRAQSADAALGRAQGSQEEKLYLLFKEDFHARQIFEFLRAETVQDLEQFSPQEIVKLLSQPIHATVRRIRQKLADRNRHLAGDEAFVIDYKERTRAD
jgi:hypothetical protein